MSRRTSRRRRLLFVALLLLFVVGLIEVGGFVTWWALTGSPFSWSGAQELRAVAAGADAQDEQDRVQAVANPGLTIHPFLGYVTNHEIHDVNGFPVSPYGFMGEGSPIRERSHDRFVVGIVGGSVALQLVLYAEDVLRRELLRSPSVQGKQLEIVCMALGGYKQPQQVFATELALLRGGGFDLLVNLDGFNEVAMVPANHEAGVPGWFPRRWAGLMDRVPTTEQLRRIGRLAVLRDQRAAAARSAGALWWSPTLQSLWLVGDRRGVAAEGELAREIERATTARGFAATGPGHEGRDVDASRAEMVEVWRRASLHLQRLCAAHGTRYFHFLQPNQYVPGAKPIGDEEARVAIYTGDRSLQPSVVHGYPLLRAAGQRLLAEGVAFADLTEMFSDHPEPLYVDTCCHLGRRGNELLAERVVSTIRRRLDLEGFAATSVEVAPTKLELAAPAQVVQLSVAARDGDGRALDVAATGLGTRYRSVPDGALLVGEGGAVRALRRGSFRLEVTVAGGARCEVPVEAHWPDVVVMADAAEAAPALRMVGEQVGARPQLQVQGLPAGVFRLLAASLKPLPDAIRPGQEAFGVASTLLPGQGAAGSAEVPAEVPAGGQPLFVRAYVVDAAGKLVTASNTLVLTRG
ncbi:MAG: hypothetical protein ACE37K_04770 [Planctomycetota bacterium]